LLAPVPRPLSGARRGVQGAFVGAVKRPAVLQAKEERTRAFYAGRATDVTKMDDRMRRVVAACTRLSPRAIIDIGCGRGFLLRTLMNRDPSLVAYGVEVSQAQAREARSAGITVFEQNVETGIALPDQSVDVAVLGEVIEHVFDPDACIEEVRRILRPGGALIVTTPNLASWLNRILLCLGVQPVFSETSTRKKYGHWLRALGQGKDTVQGHLKLFTLGALTQMLADLGFEVVSATGHKCYMLEEHPLANVVESIFRMRASLASGFVVIARKR
jgi:methionine biosynthesis protein MetW